MALGQLPLFRYFRAIWTLRLQRLNTGLENAATNILSASTTKLCMFAHAYLRRLSPCITVGVSLTIAPEA
jgi:hypothetical protein